MPQAALRMRARGLRDGTQPGDVVQCVNCYHPPFCNFADQPPILQVTLRVRAKGVRDGTHLGDVMQYVNCLGRSFPAFC